MALFQQTGLLISDKVRLLSFICGLFVLCIRPVAAALFFSNLFILAGKNMLATSLKCSWFFLFWKIFGVRPRQLKSIHHTVYLCNTSSLILVLWTFIAASFFQSQITQPRLWSALRKIDGLTLLYLSRVTIVTLAGSKIDSSKFYYFEKSVNLHSCSRICWLYHDKSSRSSCE